MGESSRTGKGADSKGGESLEVAVDVSGLGRHTSCAQRQGLYGVKRPGKVARGFSLQKGAKGYKIETSTRERDVQWGTLRERYLLGKGEKRKERHVEGGIRGEEGLPCSTF